MCAWNRRPASRGQGTARAAVGGPALPASTLLVLALLAMAPLVLVSPYPSLAAANPVLLFGPDVRPSGELSRFLDQDRRWLAGQPSAMARLPEAAKLAGRLGEPGGWEEVTGQGRLGSAGITGDGSVRPLPSMLRDRWLARGYLRADVRLVPGNPGAAAGGAPDTLVVVPGAVHTIGSLVVEGEDFPGRAGLLEMWLPRPGEVFLQDRFAEAARQVLLGTGNGGFPFARWVISEVALDEGAPAVHIRALLLPGRRARIGAVTSDLPAGPGSGFLVRASGLRVGRIFTEDDLRRARQRLLARDLYASVGEPSVYLTGSPDSVGVHFPVAPRRKVNRAQVVLGLSRKAEIPGSRLSGQVDLSLPNLAGSGRSLQVSWRDDGAAASRFGLSYREPLVFGTPLDVTTSLDQEVQTDLFTRFRLEMALAIQVVDLWGLEWGLGWDRATYPVGVLESTSRVRASGAVTHRRGDPASSGWEGWFGIESGWRSARNRSTDPDAENPSASRLGESTVQRIYRVDLAGEWWVGVTVSLHGRSSYRIQTGDAGAVPLAEQFRFGGAATVRGYNENEFHGSKTGWGGAELRLGRPGSSRVYTFFDLGYFEFLTQDPASADPAVLLRRTGSPHGFGVGLLARTRGGDLSLAIGFPGTVDFDLAKLHVALLESF